MATIDHTQYPASAALFGLPPAPRRITPIHIPASPAPREAARAIRATADPVVRIDSAGDWYEIAAPFNRAALGAWRSLPGRKWLARDKRNLVPVHARAALWQLLRDHYAGATLVVDGVDKGTIESRKAVA